MQLGSRRPSSPSPVQQRSRRSNDCFAKLDWCASHAHSSTAFESCLASEWDAEAGDREAAVWLHEEAYGLVPDMEGFAFEIGVAAYRAGDDYKARLYLESFVARADPDLFPLEFEQSQRYLGQLTRR